VDGLDQVIAPTITIINVSKEGQANPLRDLLDISTLLSMEDCFSFINCNLSLFDGSGDTWNVTLKKNVSIPEGPQYVSYEFLPETV